VFLFCWKWKSPTTQYFDGEDIKYTKLFLLCKCKSTFSLVKSDVCHNCALLLIQVPIFLGQLYPQREQLENKTKYWKWGAYQNVSVLITSRYGPRIEMCSVFSSPRENQQGMFFWSILAIPGGHPPRWAIKSQVFRERVGFVVLCIIGAYCSMRRGPDPMGTVPAFFLVIFFAACSILFHNFHSGS
jgi:hypothetical protein